MRAIKSPRMRAHPLKRSNKKMKKLLSKSYNDDYLESGSIKSISSSYSTGSRYEPQASVELSREVLDDIGLLKIQLSETIEENSMMKSRLHMELKERHSLEMKNKDLTEKLLDARKGLQETGAALYKVQQATDQLMRKRDQREIQLQRALDSNSVYEAKISELENKLAKTEDGSKVQATIASYRKIINEKDDIIRILEEQQFTSQNQLAKIKRENQRLIEEKMDYEFSLETKQKKINLLEANFRYIEDKLSGPDFANGMTKQTLFEKLMQEPFNAALSGKKFDDKKDKDEKDGDSKDTKDSKEKSGGRSEADFKILENRMAQLESQIIRQQAGGPRTPNGNRQQHQQQQGGVKMGGENDSLFFSGSVVEAAANPNAFGGMPPINNGTGRPDSNQGGRHNNRMGSPPGQGPRPNSNHQMRQGPQGGPPQGMYGPPNGQGPMNSPRQGQYGPPPQGYQQGPPPQQQYRGPPPQQQYQQGPPPQQQQQQYQQGPPPQQRGPPPQQYQQGPSPQQQQQFQQGPPPQQQQQQQQFQQGPPPQQQYQPPAQQQGPPPQQYVPPQQQQQQQAPAPQYQAPPVQQQQGPPPQQQYQPPPQQAAPPQQYAPAPTMQQPAPQAYQAPPVQQQYAAPVAAAPTPAPSTAYVNGTPVTVALNAVDPAQQYSAEARKTPASKPGSRASIIDSLLQTTAQNKPLSSPRVGETTAAPAPVAAAAPAPVVAAPTPAAAAPSVKASRGTIVGSAASVKTPVTPSTPGGVTESLETDGSGNPEWDALQKEKKELKKAIYVWTKDFVTQHQREPTKEEREGDAKEMFRRYRQNSKMIKDMEESMGGAAAMSTKMKGMSIKE